MRTTRARRPLRPAAGAAVAGLLLAAAASAGAPVRLLKLPEGGGVPAAAVDSGGTVHVAWVQDGDAWYATSTDAGRSLGPRLRVNDAPGTVHPANLFRGPDLAIGRAGRVHVIWYPAAYQQHWPEKDWGVYYARLEPGATAFTASRDLNHRPSDSFSLAADASGRVAVTWQNGTLWVQSSADDGMTFGEPRAVAGADPCECCATRTAVGPDGTLWAFYRDKAKNVRDMFAVAWPPNTDLAIRHRVSQTPWPIDACPMSGSFIRPEAGAILAAWQTEDRVLFGELELSGPARRPAELEAPAASGRFPVILENAAGEVLVAWRENGRLGWQRYDRRLRPVGRPASAPATSPHRFAGAVLPDGTFLLIP